MITEKDCKCGWVKKIDFSAPVLMSLPAKYLFKCSNCGEEEYVSEIMPQQVVPYRYPK